MLASVGLPSGEYACIANRSFSQCEILKDTTILLHFFSVAV